MSPLPAEFSFVFPEVVRGALSIIIIVVVVVLVIVGHRILDSMAIYFRILD